jgi:hypothetical protein
MPRLDRLASLDRPGSGRDAFRMGGLIEGRRHRRIQHLVAFRQMGGRGKVLGHEPARSGVRGCVI